MKVMVAPASGYTSGQALQAIAEVAQENLPAGFGYELGGMARVEVETADDVRTIYFLDGDELRDRCHLVAVAHLDALQCFHILGSIRFGLYHYAVHLTEAVEVGSIQTTVISGYSFLGGQGPSYGSLIIKLKNWEERSTMQNSTIVYATLYMRAQKIIKEAQVLFFAPPMIPGYSASSDIELNMQGSQDVIGADACFLTSGSVNVQLELREVRVEGCLGGVDFRTRFQGSSIVVHHVEEVVQITTRLVLHVQLDVA